MLNAQSMPTENNLKSQDLWDDTEDDDFDEQEFWFNAFNNMHKFMLKGKPHIKEYKKIRKLHSEISSSMMNYYYDDKFEQKVDTDYALQHKSENKDGNDTFILFESTFDPDTDPGNHAFMDMLIYKTAPNINCITEEFIKNNRYRKPEKTEFLQSMLDSKLGLFEVTETDINDGYAYIKEVFTGVEYKITDIGLSGNPNYDDSYIYMRIITYRGVSFGTGLSFPFSKKDPFIKNFINQEKKDYRPLGEFVRFIKLYNQFSKDSKGIKVIKNTFN